MQKHRERLAALAVGGQARQYGLAVRGKSLTADKVDTLDDSEVERLYACYEARLGGGDDGWGLQRSRFMRGWQNQLRLIVDLEGAHQPAPPYY